MKFNVEVEFDWVDGETNLDDEIKAGVINEMTKQMTEKFMSDAGTSIAQTADALIRAKTEMLINSVLEKPVTISNGWNDNTEYDSILDMVEKRMTALYEGKIVGSKTCTKDPLLGQIELYADNKVKALLVDVERIIIKHSDNAAKEAVKNNKLIEALDHVVKIREGIK